MRGEEGEGEEEERGEEKVGKRKGEARRRKIYNIEVRSWSRGRELSRDPAIGRSFFAKLHVALRNCTSIAEM